MASMAASPRTPASVLALAVLKGALARAIGFPIGRTTVGVKYSANNRARITVKLGDDVDKCPSDDVLASVLDIANSEFAGKSYDDTRDIIINHQPHRTVRMISY